MTVRGGNKFSRRLQEMANRVGNADKVKVGFLAKATYPDGTPVAMVAAIHNFGKWPFFSNMVREKSPEWGPAAGQLLVDNGYDAAKTLDLIGQGIEGQLRQSIRDIREPALQPSTIKRKGFDKPMVETAHMLNSVDHEVVKKA